MGLIVGRRVYSRGVYSTQVSKSRATNVELLRADLLKNQPGKLWDREVAVEHRHQCEHEAQRLSP